MTATRILALIVFLMCSALGCAQRNSSAQMDTTTDAADARTQIESLNDAMENAFRANDMKRVASFYADNGILLAPGGKRTVGRQAIDDYWTRFGARGTDLDWQLTVDSVEGDRGLYVQRGTSTITMTRDNGQRGVSFVNFILIWEQQPDGSLKIAMDGYW